jgi:hypothetical protein
MGPMGAAQRIHTAGSKEGRLSPQPVSEVKHQLDSAARAIPDGAPAGYKAVVGLHVLAQPLALPAGQASGSTEYWAFISALASMISAIASLVAAGIMLYTVLADRRERGRAREAEFDECARQNGLQRGVMNYGPGDARHIHGYIRWGDDPQVGLENAFCRQGEFLAEPSARGEKALVMDFTYLDDAGRKHRVLRRPGQPKSRRNSGGRVPLSGGRL